MRPSFRVSTFTALCVVICVMLTLVGCSRTTLERGPGSSAPDAGDGPTPDAPASDGGGDLPNDAREPCGGDDCRRLDGECVVGRCDLEIDACVREPRPDGTACDDGQTCSRGDACERGVCAGRGGLDCGPFDSSCAVGVCDDVTGGCRAEAVPDELPCEDGDLCTVGDSCGAGACRPGTTRDCADVSDACNLGVCNPMSGGCDALPVPNGTPCEDGLVCTEGESCTDGRCAGGASVNCEALDDECRIGTCVEDAGGCVGEPARDGSDCNGGDICTTGLCGGGECLDRLPVRGIGDQCGAARILAGTDGLETFDTFMICATATQFGSCGRRGSDVFFDLALGAPRRVRFETVPPTSGRFDTTLYLREDCRERDTEVACDDDGGEGDLSLIDEVLQAGDYTLVLDGGAGGGERAGNGFGLEVDIESPDTCATAVPLRLPGDRMVTTISSTTAGATNALTSSCGGGARSPEHVYEFVVGARTTLRFETIAPSDYDTVLHVREAPCATSATLFCDDDGGVGQLSRLEQTFERGTYLLVVDGFGARSSGAYRVRISNLGR